jgi:hypothetical protein
MGVAGSQTQDWGFGAKGEHTPADAAGKAHPLKTKKQKGNLMSKLTTCTSRSHRSLSSAGLRLQLPSWSQPAPSQTASYCIPPRPAPCAQLGSASSFFF